MSEQPTASGRLALSASPAAASSAATMPQIWSAVAVSGEGIRSNSFM